MECKLVYVIVGTEYGLDRVKREIKEEGYEFNFNFDGDEEALLNADEVWIFGKNHVDLRRIRAERLGKSVWIMG